MCKPVKSFNTGIKSYSFRHMKMPCKSSRAGGAPSRTDTLIGPAACGRGPNPDSLKRRARARALSLLSLDSFELCGTRRSYASRFRNCALQRAPVRWTLTSEPTIGGSLRLCQSRNGATNSKRRAFPVTSRSRFKAPHESNRRSPNRPRDTRNKELNSRWKTKQEPPACFKPIQASTN